MKQTKIRFQALCYYVRDLKASILFFRRLGFKETHSDVGFVYLRLSEKSDFVICLKEASVEKEVGKIVVEFLPAYGECFYDLFNSLVDKGFDFANHTSEEMYGGYMGYEIEIKEPNGMQLEMTYTEMSDYIIENDQQS